MSKFLEAAAIALLLATPAAAGGFGLGRPATEAEVKAWDIDVAPYDRGLPEGQGSVSEGEEIYLEKCAYCHGDFGEGVDRWPVLAGGQGSLTEDRPVKTIGSYWPYLSTVWDYVHRAMPFPEPASLTPNEVYAITAYLLYVNDIVSDEDFVLSRENFASIRMPNEKNFYVDNRDVEEGTHFRGVEPCMENCKDEVKITMRAAVLDVTPEDAAARKRREEAARKARASETAQAAPAETAEAAAAGETMPEGAAAPAEEAPAKEATPAAAPAAPDPKLVKKGEKVFRKCKSCHEVGEGARNKTGPELNDLFGRPAGSVEGFRYSQAMKEAGQNGLVWTDETLHQFLKKPKAFIKGTKMSFSGLKKDSDIEALLAYLRQFDK